MKCGLDNENSQALSLVQALLGAISPNMRAVALVTRDSRVTLRFLLAEDWEEDREEVEDIAFEFEALQPKPVAVQTEVLVDERPIAALGNLGRMVFLRKELTSS